MCIHSLVQLDEPWDDDDTDNDIVMNTDDSDDEVDLLPQFDGASDKVPGKSEQLYLNIKNVRHITNFENKCLGNRNIKRYYFVSREYEVMDLNSDCHVWFTSIFHN